MRKQRTEYEDLPTSLENAIDGMTIVDRGMIEGDDGEMIQRTMLMFAGETVASWHHSEEETRKRLKAGWKLTEGQLLAAMRMIKGRISAALKAAAPFSATPRRTGWMDMSYRPRKCFSFPGDDNDE